MTPDRRRDLWPHQTALFAETDSVQSRQKRCSGRLCWTVTVTDTTFCSVNGNHTHTHWQGHFSQKLLWIRIRILFLGEWGRNICIHINIYLKKKRREMSVLPLLVSVCPILIPQWVYWLSLPVLSNVSQLLWLWLLPKLQPAPRLLQVIVYGTGGGGNGDVWRALIKTYSLCTNQCWQCVCQD